MNRWIWWSGCGVRAASQPCGVNAYFSMHLAASYLHTLHENGNLDLSWAAWTFQFECCALSAIPPSHSRLSFTAALLLCTLPSICDPPPHSTALTPSCRPSISALINLLSRCRPHSWRWTSQLFLSPLTSPSLALFGRPLPWVAPSINHASNSRTTRPALSLPSAHPLKTLISISCLH